MVHLPPEETEGPPHTGTTIVAVQYNGGVVLGADSRVSTGNYISNRASDKITSLTECVYLLRSGSAADTQAVSDYGRLILFYAQYFGFVCGDCMPAVNGKRSRWRTLLDLVCALGRVLFRSALLRGAARNGVAA